jgi:hypothetical protein
VLVLGRRRMRLRIIQLRVEELLLSASCVKQNAAKGVSVKMLTEYLFCVSVSLERRLRRFIFAADRRQRSKPMTWT